MPSIRRWLAGRRTRSEGRTDRERGGRVDGCVCPHCGADVPPRRLACPACGASESDGWPDDRRERAEEAESWGEEEDFDYDEFVDREFGSDFGSGRARSPDPKRLILWLIIAAMLLASLALLG